MKYNVNKVKVGERIFKIRNSLNLTLEQFGKLDNLKASKSIVLRWENGTSLPNRSRLEIIAQKGNITVNELLYSSIEEFVTTNFENLILDSEYPYPASFDVYVLLGNLELKKNNTITINNIDVLKRFFYSDILYKEVEYIYLELDSVCEYMLKNREKTKKTYIEHIQSIDLLNKTRYELERSLTLDLKKFYRSDFIMFIQTIKSPTEDLEEIAYHHAIKYYPLLKELYNKMRIAHLDDITDIEKIQNESKAWSTLLENYNENEQQIILEFFDKLENKGTTINENDFDEVKKIVANRLDEVEQNGKEKVTTDLTNDIVNYYKDK